MDRRVPARQGPGNAAAGRPQPTGPDQNGAADSRDPAPPRPNALVDTRILAAARGDRPADLIFRRARVVNVFTAEIEAADVAVAAGVVVGLGSGYDAETIVDLDGAYLAPSWIDAHVHIESSMVTPAQFARAVVPRGTTTVVVDPHEIANVHGAQGIDYMLAASADLPLDVQVQIPSCVPATDMGTAGAE
ncbi:MAG: adenine deaminase, partial [Gemmatimonadetes bacterium]|nr:adenine deaminase [Gemmatimonadota bacterium]